MNRLSDLTAGCFSRGGGLLICALSLYYGLCVGAFASPVIENSITVYGGLTITRDEAFIAPDTETWTWRLNVNAASNWRHQSLQSPGGGWIAEIISSECGGLATFTRTNIEEGGPERRFQRHFTGIVLPCGDEGPPPDTEWHLYHGRSEYYIQPTQTNVCVNQSVQFSAFEAVNDPVYSEWDISPSGGIDPYPLPDGTTVSFVITDSGNYVVTGTRKYNPKNYPDTHDSAVVNAIETILVLDDVEFRADGAEEDEYVVVLLNDGFEEGNKDGEGKPVPDHLPDYVEGHRITGADHLIVAGSARIEGLAGIADGLEGKWTLTYDGNIMIWASDGDGGYDLVESGVQGDSVPASETFNFLVEGVSRSSALNDVNIMATFDLDSEAQNAVDIPCDLEVEGELTVAGITSVVWEEIDSPLTANSYPVAGADIGLRIFPGKQTPTDDVVRDTVLVVATIEPGNAEVAQAVTDKGGVRFKSFDVNDPSTNEAPVDPNGAQGNDNRGYPKAGTLESANNPADVVFVGGAAIATNVFKVTMQPGDNFRVAASFYQDKLDELQVTDPDGDHFVHEAEDVVGFENAMTELLTVWRRLHVEMDSMEAVHTEGEQSNIVRSHIIEVTPDTNDNFAREVKLDIDLTDLPSGTDNSLNLSGGSTAAYHGRFENGEITIGNETTGSLIGNGIDFVRKEADGGIIMPFEVSHPNQTNASGRVIGYSISTGNGNGDPEGTFTLNTMEGELVAGHAGGTITVAGIPMTIDSIDVGAKTVTVVDPEDIPFKLVDDDDLELLPQLPDVSELDNALAYAYVVPDYETVKSNQEIPFVLNNTDFEILQHWDSAGDNQETFWIVYIVQAYQGAVTLDRDPDSESRLWGMSSAISGGAIVYLEVHLEHEGVGNPARQEQNTVIHEVGHAVGDSGDEPVTNVDHLPASEEQIPAPRYTDNYIDHIRSQEVPVSP